MLRITTTLALAVALGALPRLAHAQEEVSEDEHTLEALERRAEAAPSTTTTPPTTALSAIGRVIIEERTPAGWWSHAADAYPLDPPRQRARMPRRCRTRGGYREFCQGARIVPTPSGPAAELAAWLSLGQRATAIQMMHQPAFDEWRAAAAGLDPEPRLTFPVPVGHMGRGFGYTRDAGLAHTRHDGVDIGAPEGSDIVAARGGLVMYADNGVTGMGNVLIVLHSDGSSALYAHCHEIFVFAGQYVERGQRVALVGETGFARAPHLHFEWRRNGSPLDPARHFLPRQEDDEEGEHPAPVADLHSPAITDDERAALVTPDDEP